MSFRWKTILGIAIIETILLVILVSSVLFFQNKSHNQEVIHRTQSTAKLFASMTKDSVLATDLATLESFVTDILSNKDIVYAKVIGDNIILAQGGGENFLNKPFVLDRQLDDVDDGIFDVYYPIKEGEHKFGRVELGFSIKRIDQTLNQTKNWAITIAIIEIILVAIFSLVLGTWLTSRLLELRQASELITKNGPGHQVQISGSDEVSSVAQAFNEMSENLGKSYQELENKSKAYSAIAELASRSEALNATIISACLDGMITIDAHGIIIEYNPAAEKIFGYSREQAIHSNMAELIIPSEFRDAHYVGLQKYLKTGHGPVLNKRLELEGLHKNGHVFPIELTISAIENNDSAFFTAFVRDISEPKLAEEKLKKARQAAEQASEAKSRFLATMSHEIRTPMNALIGTIGLLKDGALDSEQQMFLNTADSAANGLLSLINDILDFSKIEANKLVLDRDIFHLPSLIKEVINIFSSSAEEKQIRLFYDIDAELPEYYCSDPARLRQVLLNLLGNALKFTSKGQISVTIHKVKQENDIYTLCFEVQDSGIGVSPENIDLLFKEFSQLEFKHNRRFEGSGLGLAISKKLVNLFDGEIGVESQIGQGSKFWFTTKLKYEEHVQKQKSLKAKEKKQALKILLAEDSDANIVVAKAILEKAGHRVQVAKNGLLAIKLLENDNSFDLVLMDIMMPEMDGIEATRLIRKMPLPTGKLPIIAMTANAMMSDKELCFEAGMNDYMSKPYVVEQLYEKIERLTGTLSSKTIGEKNHKAEQEFNDSNEPILDKATLEKLAHDTSPEAVPEMITIFLHELQKRSNSLKSAKKNNNVEDIAMQVHALKSSAGTYGAIKLQNIAIKIDLLCKQNQFEQAILLVDSILSIIYETELEYKRRVVINS